jgi:Fe-S-cluster containining protein
MNHHMIPLSATDTFHFSCTKTISCFNECCRDLNQFLTPYDILRLKNHLGLSSALFLERYTTEHVGPESGLPVLSLRSGPPPARKCPFVTPAGCRVYANRPSSCRTYPLVRLASRSRETGQISEHFMILQEPHCHGFEQLKTQTVREWIANQELEPYFKMNDKLMEIISLKRMHKPGPLDIKSRHIFRMALYDIDTFRNQIIEHDILSGENLSAETLDTVKSDDEELLHVGLKWVKNMLFRT